MSRLRKTVAGLYLLFLVSACSEPGSVPVAPQGPSLAPDHVTKESEQFDTTPPVPLVLSGCGRLSETITVLVFTASDDLTPYERLEYSFELRPESPSTECVERGPSGWLLFPQDGSPAMVSIELPSTCCFRFNLSVRDQARNIATAECAIGTCIR
jgi:hypothetical protein